jgi:hypothetical protein
MTRPCVRAGLFAGALAAAACGGGGGSPTGPTPPPVDTTPQTQAFTGTVDAYGISSHGLTPSRAGSLTATLTWTLGADLDVYVTAASCTGYPPDNCVLLARSASTSTTTLREEVTLTVTASAPLLLWVDNFHPTASVSYTIATVITPNGT